MKTPREMAEDIVKREGGYNDVEGDSGGATNYGISLRYAKGKPELDLDHDGDIDKYDIKMVTPEIAVDCYLEDFLQAPGLDTIDARMQPQCFDISVNAGGKRAVILLQSALSACGAKIHIDGDMGPATRKAVSDALASNTIGFTKLNNTLVARRIAFYERLAQQPKNAKFLKGWKNRARSFLV